MELTFDAKAAKRPTNVSVNSDLLQKAKSLNINLSATLEAALAQAVREQAQAQWKEQNQQAFAAYDQYVQKHGMFNADTRGF